MKLQKFLKMKFRFSFEKFDEMEFFNLVVKGFEIEIWKNCSRLVEKFG